MIIESPQPLLI